MSTSTGGFTSADCDSVRGAVAATQLETPPTDPAAARPRGRSSCQPSEARSVLARDDDAVQDFDWVFRSCGSAPPTTTLPSTRRAARARCSPGTRTPKPYGDPHTSSTATSSGFTVPAGGADLPALPPRLRLRVGPGVRRRPGCLLRRRAGPGPDAEPVDGCLDDGDRPALGQRRANRTLQSSPTAGLRGRQSRLRLQPRHPHLAGGQERPGGAPRGRRQLRLPLTAGGSTTCRLYTCPNAVASVPATTVAAKTTSATVSWTAAGHTSAAARSRRTASRAPTAP